MKVRTRSRSPGGSPSLSGSHSRQHRASVQAMGAATSWNCRLRLRLQDERLQRQQSDEHQQEQRCDSFHSLSLAAMRMDVCVSPAHCEQITYKVFMPHETANPGLNASQIRSEKQMTENELFACLEGAGPASDTLVPLVVTSNPRAARTLRDRYATWQRQKKRLGWRTPRILTWDAWLVEMWDEQVMAGAEARARLTQAQERTLWQQVIRAGSDSGIQAAPAVAFADSFAELAQTAYQLLEEYCIPPAELNRSASGKDAQAFAIWLRAFQRQCDRRGFVTAASVPRLLKDRLETLAGEEVIPTQQILLIGFDRVPPLQKSLLTALQQRGCTCEYLCLTADGEPKTAPVVMAASTMQEQMHAAAMWIRERLLENPDAKIGVVAPAMAVLRDALYRTFRSVLAPSAMRLSDAEPQLPYEFSLGVPMRQLPQVRAALLLLRWLQNPIAWEDASFLLTSGHIGGQSSSAQQQADAARLDAAIRKDPQAMEAEAEFAWLLRRLREKDGAALPDLRERLRNVATLAQHAAGTENTRRTYAEWSETIEQMLRAAGWSVYQAKTSAEFQLLTRWNFMLEELAMLDAIAERVSYSTLLVTLRDAAARTLYALETQNAPVQILGIPESAGLTFDAVWFLNASATAWPPRGHAQSWIPWHLQRQAAMPYADAVADENYARATTQRILASSHETVFSFALEDVDEHSGGARTAKAEVRISPILLQVLPQIPITVVESRKLQPTIEVTEEVTEEVKSEAAVLRTTTKVRQGVQFLKLQAACPFQAFAELRLGAARLEDPALGLDRKDQGSVIHDVLRLFWTEIKDQATLRALSSEQRRTKVTALIEIALSEVPARSAMEKALLATEAERLCERVLAWLQIEEQRPDFSVVACEQTIPNATIGEVQADCRIDRIDRVGSGENAGLALMDYKTGSINANACDGDRPDEPQLPAYAMLMRHNFSAAAPLRGVALASLQAKDMAFKIIHSLPQTFTANDPRNTKSRTPILQTIEQMESQVDAWQDTLLQLADDFQAGVATVDPKNATKTCKFCAQGIFCRIKEAQTTVENGDEDEGIEGETE